CNLWSTSGGSKAVAKLTYQTSNGEETVDLGDDPVTVGRQLGNFITLKDDQISRFHCVIEFKRGVLGVRDLGSRNGTYVNGQKISAKRLKDGDKVRVGKTEFVVDLAETNGEAAPAPTA